MDDALALLVLPGALEGSSFEAHARELLSIPRVLALEPSRFRAPRFLREAAAARQAARIWLPGRLRVVVLYEPSQYPLARALCAEYTEAELWYLPPTAGHLEPGGTWPKAASGSDAGQWLEFDQAARQRAAGVLIGGADGQDEPLRERLQQLDVISTRAFVPGGQFRRRRSRKGSSAS